MRRFAVLVLLLIVALLPALAAACASPTATPIPTATPVPPTATPTPAPTVTSTPTPMPTCSEPNDEGIGALLAELKSCSLDISEDTRELIDLLIILEGFREDPEFHQVGFGVCCRFHVWLEEAESLRDRADIDSLVEVGLVPGDVIQIALEYVRSTGQPTEYTESMMSTLESEARRTMGLEQPRSIPTDSMCSPNIELGEWVYQLASTISERITIFCDAAGQWQMATRFSDGSGRTANLLESQSPIGQRFDIVGNAFGEYFVVDSNGNLRLGDRIGFFGTARKLSR